MSKVIVTIARDENLYINEWVRHHIDLGFDQIFVYDNYSDPPLQNEIDKLPDEYRRKVIVEMQEIMENPQVDAYGKGLNHYMESADWIAFIDVDEFITVPSGDLEETLQRYNRPSVGAVVMGWQFYNANGQEKYEDKPVQERFTQSCKHYDRCCGKSIVRPSYIAYPGVHYPLLLDGYLVEENNIGLVHCRFEATYEHIYIKHYYTKSYEEWIWKLQRGSCDSRCLKKYDEFFLYNPDLLYMKDENLMKAQMNCMHGELILKSTQEHNLVDGFIDYSDGYK